MQEINNIFPLPPTNRRENIKLHSDITFTDQNPEFIEFKQNVKKWLKLDDDIRTLRKAINERNKQKKELTPLITNFMNENKISDLNTKDGKIKYKTSFYKKPLNHKTIQNRLTDFFQDIKKGERATQYLLDNRERVEKTLLSRSIIKKKNLTL